MGTPREALREKGDYLLLLFAIGLKERVIGCVYFDEE